MARQETTVRFKMTSRIVDSHSPINERVDASFFFIFHGVGGIFPHVLQRTVHLMAKTYFFSYPNYLWSCVSS